MGVDMDDLIRLNLQADATQAAGALKEVSGQAVSLDVELKKAGEAGEVAGQQIQAGMTKAMSSTTEATHAARLLGEEVGIRLPRALSSVLAHSETLGPILAGAFSTIAVIGFIGIAEQVGEKLSEVISSTFIFTDSMKGADEATKILNVELGKQEDRLDASEKAFTRVGLSADKLARLRIGDELEKNLKEVNDALAKSNEALSKQSGFWVGMLKNASDFYGFTKFAAKEADERAVNERNNQTQAKLASDDAKKTAEEENAILDKQAALREAAAIKEAQRKDIVNYADALDHVAANAVKAAANLEKLQNENKKISFELLISQDKDLQAREDDIAHTEVTLNGALLAQIQLVQKVGAARVKAAQDAAQADAKQQMAMDALGGRLNAIFDTTTLVKKGWAEMGKQALQSLDEIGLALIKHLAIALLTDDMEKISSAKKAAAGAYAAMAPIPIVGPALGAAAAASAFATAMAFEQGGIMSAQAGAITDAYGPGVGTPAILHPNEMVLPAPISQTIQDMTASASGGKGAGGDIHVHAMDAASFQTFLKRNPGALARGIEHSADRGHLNMSKIARGK